MKPSVTLRDALGDPALLGDAMPGQSWFPWRTVLTAAVGEALVSDEERAVFRKLTGRDHEPGAMVEILLTIAGRRSGKSKAMAVLSVYFACLCDWTENLSLGERGVALYLAPSERQAANVFRYARAIIDHSLLLRELVETRTESTLTLTTGVDLEVQAASWRRSRGSTAVCVCLDECAFFHNADDAANSDTELMVALRPSLATTGGPMLLTSSPATMEGTVFRLHKRHYGPAGDPLTLVLQSDSRALNPSLSEKVVARAFEDDPVAAEAEYGGVFRQPVSAYLERAIVEKAVTRGARVVLPGVQYLAFVDVSGGTGTDSYTAAVGHNQCQDGRDIAVVDAVFEARPPFDPDEVTMRCAAFLRPWGVNHVVGDAYGAAWPISVWGREGCAYQHASLTASEIYLHCIAAFTAGRVSLPDVPRLVDQLCGLRRRVGQGGRETVQHSARGHDDLANCVAGLLWRLTPAVPSAVITGPIIVTRNSLAPHLGSGPWVDPFAAIGGSAERGLDWSNYQ